ncbi:MAG TPA: phosphatidylglycerophosphatase A [Acidimicrobiia bacterium]|jgi:phosphatidylglycerophosphatase A
MRRLIASSLGLGLIPRRLWRSDAGAGTFGASLGAGVGGLVLVLHAPWWLSAGVAAAAMVVSVWAAAPFGADHADPGWVCIDETAGTLVALVGLGGIPWVAALVIARAADIVKVLPGVRAAEHLPGGVGITADDVVAGLYGLAVGWVFTGLLG